MASKDAAQQSLIEVLKELQKTHSTGYITNLSNQHYQLIPTGNYALEEVLGLPGLARQKILEMFGPSSSGKSAVMTHVAGYVVKNGGRVLYVDYEDSLDATFAQKLGVKLGGPNFLVFSPKTLEEGFETSIKILNTGDIDLVIYDSVGAMVPRNRVERASKGLDAMPADQAKALAANLSVLWSQRDKHNCAYVFINHIRAAGFSEYSGADETVSGGNALKYYKHQSVRVTRVQYLKLKGVDVGQEIKLHNMKNKLANPRAESRLKLFFDDGMDGLGFLVDELNDHGIIEIGPTGWIKSSLLPESIRGKDNFLELVKSDIALQNAFLSALRIKKDIVEKGDFGNDD